MENKYKNTALAYAHAGLSVIPTAADKRPGCAWKPFTGHIASDKEIDSLFNYAGGIGIVTGKVSGNLELLDFDDGGSAFEPWLAKIPHELADRLVIERSPSGGKHVYYRVDGGVPGNRKLAMKAGEDGKPPKVLIETRGEGGYVKCCPSPDYTLEQGNFMHVPSVTPFEQEIMIRAAVELDGGGGGSGGRILPPQYPVINLQSSVFKVGAVGNGQGADRWEPGMAAASSRPPYLEITPWEDYNARGDIGELLGRHGWKKTKGGDNEHWERPGKNEGSTSATWNGTVFFVFSSNAAGFEPNKGYGKFQVYAQLECGGDMKEAARRLRAAGYGGGSGGVKTPPQYPVINLQSSVFKERKDESAEESAAADDAVIDPGALPEELLHVPGFVDALTAHTLATAPYPNRPLAFAGALTMLAHLTGRNFRDVRNLRTNVYVLALADSGVGKDFPRKVNMNLAAEVGIMPTMADRFASAEGLEDALLVHPSSFFQVDEVDTLFAALQEKKDSANEKIYGSLLQFATSSDTTYAMRKKAIQQTGGKAGQFDKVRARGIREPHLTLLGCAIPKYLYSALSERALENGLMSRCLILEAGERGKAGTPHAAAFPGEVTDTARDLVAHGGFEGLDLENLGEEPPPYVEPITVPETAAAAARHAEVTARCEAYYDAAKTTAEKALWSRGAEKTARLALLYAISGDPYEPIVDAAAFDWAWKFVEHTTKRMLYQASVWVHDNEFDALRQKALRYLRDYGKDGAMNHGQLLKRMHIDADTFRKVIETLLESELITAVELAKGGFRYGLVRAAA